jgi:hypothetical protein
MAEQQTAQEREAQAQNIETIKARRKQVTARLKSAGDAERTKLQEELDSIDANLQTLGAEVDQPSDLVHQGPVPSTDLPPYKPAAE